MLYHISWEDVLSASVSLTYLSGRETLSCQGVRVAMTENRKEEGWGEEKDADDKDKDSPGADTERDNGAGIEREVVTKEADGEM